MVVALQSPKSIRCCCVRDKVVVASEREALVNSLSDNVDKARLLAVMAPHSGDWLHALPLSSCGLRLDDSAVHTAVGL